LISGGALSRATVHRASVPSPYPEIQTAGKMNFIRKVCADDKVRRFTFQVSMGSRSGRLADDLNGP
jgi:hypothetical protein